MQAPGGIRYESKAKQAEGDEHKVGGILATNFDFGK
jgi:hypothetical protein